MKLFVYLVAPHICGEQKTASIFLQVLMPGMNATRVWPASAQAGDTTAIWRAAFRETGVSRHEGDLIKGPPMKPLENQRTMVSRGLYGVLNWAPIMPKDVSFSDT